MSMIDNETKEGTPRFKKGNAFVGMAPLPLVFMEVNEVKVSQSYTKENGCKTGCKVGCKNGGDNVPSLSPVLSPVVTSLKENVLKFNMTPES